jgi:hypothetical protein
VGRSRRSALYGWCLDRFPADADARDGDAMIKILFPAVAISLQAVAFADGGSIQLRREAGDLAITAFTSPVPLSVGLSDISVLIQNRNALDPVLDADVRLILHSEASNIEFEAHS